MSRGRLANVRGQFLAAVRWMLILVPLSVTVGSASAFFIWSQDWVTQFRFDHPWILWLLPAGGLMIGLLYHAYGKSVTAGNNLLIDEIHQPGAGVPRRLAPLILLTTLMTHLFGGSAGREGTAVQMGGGIAGTFARVLKLDAVSVRILLMAGVAAGFGSIFGTPVAGAVFALEVLMIGRVQYEALLPCFVASLLSHWVCHAWGAHHTVYTVAVNTGSAQPDLILFAKVVFAAFLFGKAGSLFSWLSHQCTEVFRKTIAIPYWRPVAGGFAVIGLYYLCGTDDYLGLGLWSNRPDAITLPAMFTDQPVPATAWLWKMVFTVVTLSSGFKGGEVTPLFFIGAALGNTLAGVLGVPADLFASLGFVAIFAGATNAPLASILLGIELFGAGNGLYIAAACIVAYRFSGHRGIYTAQRLTVPKFRRFGE